MVTRSSFLPEKSHGQRSLAGYSPWDRRVRHDLVIKQQQQYRGDAQLLSLSPFFFFKQRMKITLQDIKCMSKVTKLFL